MDRERLGFLRGNFLSISVWNTYEQIVDACCRTWNDFIDDTRTRGLDNHPELGTGQSTRRLESYQPPCGLTRWKGLARLGSM